MVMSEPTMTADTPPGIGDGVHVGVPLSVDAGNEVEDLISRMRCGDRAAAAEFVTRFGSRIRRRIRGKLGPTMRRLFDSQEIMSTLGRRLDLYVLSGKLEAASEPQIWALLFKMADHALLDKGRVLRRLAKTEGEDGDFAQTVLNQLRTAERHHASGVELTIDAALRSLENSTDRQILSMWLHGTPHSVTAETVGLAPAAVRKRWEKIRGCLRDKFDAEGSPC